MPREKTYRISVYGVVTFKKRTRVKSYWRAGTKVKSHYRTTTATEQRRWDLKGTKPELWAAVRYIKRRRAAPKVRHKRISARTFLRNPDKWIDIYEMEGRAES
ncbi:MAG: hypothetical protein AVW06_04560 [Hadesarchaea archaeon DG-33-1]|nr:MAG: hypothetical protein AVW06_04560 [Hadesarchaea archaeon DG-33-1]